ncbi:hypothetical protein ACFV6G_26380 [Streptomyces lavendulae]|uniref:hypothetical protein n=1 Tax=Streptomyces lavendulae TaxID=1914 RepID=UPI00367EE235
MTTTPRPRFSVRTGLAAANHDGPFEGVPEHLLESLQFWVRDELTYTGSPDVGAAQTVCLRLRIRPTPVHSNFRVVPPNYIAPLAASTDTQLLDVVDALLAVRVETEDVNPASMAILSRMLDDAGSAYRVTEAFNGLEERVTPAVRDAVRHTIADAAAAPGAGSAADHLAAAWQAAYGRSPDPVRAYSESIKAVESAAHAVIQPNNAKATLGTMLGEFKQARHKFTTALPSPAGDPVAPVEAMMRALWEGQTSRHGAQNGTVPEPLEAARAGVHLAAALVQWFVSGAVIRTP